MAYNPAIEDEIARQRGQLGYARLRDNWVAQNMPTGERFRGMSPEQISYMIASGQAPELANRFTAESTANQGQLGYSLTRDNWVRQNMDSLAPRFQGMSPEEISYRIASGQAPNLGKRYDEFLAGSRPSGGNSLPSSTPPPAGNLGTMSGQTAAPAPAPAPGPVINVYGGGSRAPEAGRASAPANTPPAPRGATPGGIPPNRPSFDKSPVPPPRPTPGAPPPAPGGNPPPPAPDPGLQSRQEDIRNRQLNRMRFQGY